MYKTSSEVCFQLVVASCERGKRTLNGVVSEYKKMDVLLLHPGDECVWVADPGEELTIRSFKTENLDSIEDFFREKDLLVEKEETETVCSDSRVKKALEYIHLQFKTGKCTLGHIAQHVCLEETSLSRLFSQVMQKTFQDYMDEIRIAAVVSRLHEKETIGGIAMECGFSSPTNFRRAFRKIHQTTPTLYRAEHGLHDGRRID